MFNDIKELEGKKILKIYGNQDYLQFETDNGSFCYTVEGDCCSHSYFHDFYGVKKLFDNGAVVSTKSIDLLPDEKLEAHNKADDNYDDHIECYGFEIVTVSPEFGEQTSVFSFRNSSNGYYGGWINVCPAQDVTKLKEITDDVTEFYET